MGKVKYTGATTAYLTTNGEYPIVAVGPGSGVGALVVIVSDTGALYTIDTNGANFQIIELYAPVRMI